MLFVPLFSLAIDLFIEPLTGLTRRGIKSCGSDLEEGPGAGRLGRYHTLAATLKCRFVISPPQEGEQRSHYLFIHIQPHGCLVRPCLY